ncbi:site-specific integrase [Halobacterium sp. CBA1126]|uniref:tyrosine-type recombinase/integrase n=1 Tax=Halobacterium sp. CBA1126 TaxID=2668074 RepID=UPI0012FA084C|nr:site-specific integrase [Halobacterium sp. CBA1126]MUV60207.1 tyrosine-type recombinase/integrase [Halobacterium sp. CBA1126]
MKIESESPDSGDVELPRPPVSDNNSEALEQFGGMVESDYHDFKHSFMEWLLTEGKDTYRLKGYSDSTVEHTHYKVDEAYRWKWSQTGEYTTTFTPEDATELVDFMVRKTSHPDRYVYGFEKSVRRLFKYFREELNRDVPEWEHDIPIQQSKGSSDHIKDKFSPAEMNAVYEAALGEYSLPSYHNKNLSSDARSELKALVAQRLGMPKEDVGPSDFTDASSWKVPSIIAVTADTGLRPIEVGRAQVDWFDLENNLMVVPADESTKNRENWECWLSSKTSNAVGNWLEEREQNSKYDGRGELWLTRQGNKYKARALNKMLDKLMESAGIDSNTRQLSWYSFRHGAATLWVREEDLARAKTQLRHKSIKTTEKYTRNSDGKNRNENGLW